MFLLTNELIYTYIYMYNIVMLESARKYHTRYAEMRRGQHPEAFGDERHEMGLGPRRLELISMHFERILKGI